MDLLEFMMELDIYYYLEVQNTIRYFISVKSGIANIIFHNHVKIKVDSHDFYLITNNDFSQCYNMLSQFGIKIKITITIIHFKKNARMNYLKDKFLYK